MNDSRPHELDDRRHTLLRGKLGNLLAWKPPEIVETVGPYDPSVFSSFDFKRQKLVDECTDKLLLYEDAVIALMTERRSDAPADALQDWRSFRTEEIDRLQKRLPAWFGGGFGHPEYAADFENWCKMPSFSVAETLLLSVGVEPGHFQKKSLDAMNKGGLHGLQGPLKFLMMRYEQLTRKFDSQGYDSRVRPTELNCAGFAGGSNS